MNWIKRKKEEWKEQDRRKRFLVKREDYLNELGLTWEPQMTLPSKNYNDLAKLLNISDCVTHFKLPHTCMWIIKYESYKFKD